MNHDFSRREFFSRTGTTAAGLALTALAPAAFAIEPFARSGKPKLMLSLAGYSFRQYFKEGKGIDSKSDPARRIDMMQFIDYCADHDCAAETTAYYFPANVTDEFLVRLKHHAFLRGVPISGSAIGNTFTYAPGPKRDEQIKYAKEWIDHAAVLGTTHIRVFAGEMQKGSTKDEAKKLCIEALEETCDYAGKKGIVLGLENHGGIVAEAADILDIIRAVKSPWFGVNWDSGNFHTDDPYHDLELIAPYAVNVQWKAEVQPRAAKEKQPADLKRIVKILRDANYQGYLALEYEAAEDPWTAVPRLLNEMRAVVAG